MHWVHIILLTYTYENIQIRRSSVDGLIYGLNYLPTVKVLIFKSLSGYINS